MPPAPTSATRDREPTKASLSEVVSKPSRFHPSKLVRAWRRPRSHKMPAIGSEACWHSIGWRRCQLSLLRFPESVLSMLPRDRDSGYSVKTRNPSHPPARSMMPPHHALRSCRSPTPWNSNSFPANRATARAAIRSVPARFLPDDEHHDPRRPSVARGRGRRH